MVTNREEQIRLIAFQLWEKDGRPQGKHFQHWIEAERIWEERMRERSAASRIGTSAAESGDGSASVRPQPSRVEEKAGAGATRAPGLKPRPAAARPPEPEKKPPPSRPSRTKRPEK